MADLKLVSYVVPSAQDFLGGKRLTPLWTAGFLKSLISTFKQHLESNPRALDSSSWMSIFSERRKFTFSQCTVEGLKQIDGIKQFCLFLDEFVSDPWAVFVRNLSRAVGLRCIVSSRNTGGIFSDAPSQIGVSRRDRSSGTAGQIAWAVVICRLSEQKRKTLLEAECNIIVNPNEADKWAFLTFAESDQNGRQVIKYLTIHNTLMMEWKVKYTLGT